MIVESGCRRSIKGELDRQMLREYIERQLAQNSTELKDLKIKYNQLLVKLEDEERKKQGLLEERDIENEIFSPRNVRKQNRGQTEEIQKKIQDIQESLERVKGLLAQSEAREKEYLDILDEIVSRETLVRDKEDKRTQEENISKEKEGTGLGTEACHQSCEKKKKSDTMESHEKIEQIPKKEKTINKCENDLDIHELSVPRRRGLKEENETENETGRKKISSEEIDAKPEEETKQKAEEESREAIEEKTLRISDNAKEENKDGDKELIKEEMNENPQEDGIKSRVVGETDNTIEESVKNELESEGRMTEENKKNTGDSLTQKSLQETRQFSKEDKNAVEVLDTLNLRETIMAGIENTIMRQVESDSIVDLGENTESRDSFLNRNEEIKSEEVIILERERKKETEFLSKIYKKIEISLALLNGDRNRCKNELKDIKRLIQSYVKSLE